ncbi:sulfate transporter 3.1-like [Zingiber officinale]|uniref:sulfate transporter 3.1-like n=1 Tax=Zingiber officinale TaxID=94328 RepID=UPI001C4C7583|nr:sulfate transporter 3.1-like [Zingiber officinale]
MEEAAEAPRRRGSVPVPPARPFLDSFRSNVKETFFPDDPLRDFRHEKGWRRRTLAALAYVFPVVGWLSQCTLSTVKSDVIAGVTIASLAIPQGISYAKLANLPPLMGLYASFVPPLVYAMMGTSKHMAVGPVATASLVMASLLESEVVPAENPTLYLHLALTATLLGGIFQAALGILRLGFIIDFLSHSVIKGFMGGTATLVCLQQLKGVLGLKHFTTSTDIINVLRAIFSQTHEWRWETAVMGICFLVFLFITRYISKKKPNLFWVAALSPLVSVILGSLVVYLLHLENHGVQVIGFLKKGINPPSLSNLVFTQPHLTIALKAGIITGIIGLAEAIAVGRIFAIANNYNVDGNKEMIAFGMMNIVGSMTSCLFVAGPFSRSAVNANAGCKTALSNVIMSVMVMIILMFLMPLFQHTPSVVLSAIIMAAMLPLIHFGEMFNLWRIDAFDFVACMGSFFGVIFGSIEIGLFIGVALNLVRVLLFIVRPKTFTLGNMPNTSVFVRTDQYPQSQPIPGYLILRIDAPIFFANASYLKERLERWIEDEEEKLKFKGNPDLQYIILDFTAVASIDTSGINMLKELKDSLKKRGLQLGLASPSSEVIKKLDRSGAMNVIGEELIFLTVDDAVVGCSSRLSKESVHDDIP